MLLSQGEERGLLAFGATENHVHETLAAGRDSAGSFAHYVETALRWQLDLGARFERAHIRSLNDQRHAYNAFHYVHRQDAPSGAFDEKASIDLEVLAEAAAAALALAELRGRSAEVARARRAAVHAAGPDVPSAQLGECLGIGVRSVQVLRQERREPALIAAVAKQALLRAATPGNASEPWSDQLPPRRVRRLRRIPSRPEEPAFRQRELRDSNLAARQLFRRQREVARRPPDRISSFRIAHVHFAVRDCPVDVRGCRDDVRGQPFAFDWFPSSHASPVVRTPSPHGVVDASGPASPWTMPPS